MKTTPQARREAKLIFRLCLVNGLLDEARVRQFAQRVIQTRPRGGLGILSHFYRLVKLETARHTAKVESATPLPPDLSASLQTRLERLYGPALNISIAHTPALLGGVRITIGSDVYDSSVQTRLAALEERF